MHIPSHTYHKAPQSYSKVHSPPLPTPTPPTSTQIITFSIRDSATLDDPTSLDGQIWNNVLDILQNWPGFRRLYWGRHVEEAWKVQVLVVRETLTQHHAFLTSPQWTTTTHLLRPLYPAAAVVAAAAAPNSETTDTAETKPEVHHAALQNFTTNPRTLCNAPVTGTAIYLTTSNPGWEKAWSLWTTLVPSVKGCLGCTGGWIAEAIDGHEGAYVVYVGWESIEDHDVYHHTRDFARKRVILEQHNAGWRGYGHVRFLGGRGGDNEGKRREGRL
ncbi:hypothetical protein BDW62DRAFT_200929 [Aspergillus aurantiobrunneus]